MADRLVVRGAREHNLKDVSLDLPRDALIVFTGLSGSGKSSLAFDTIFAEGQRRYVESPVGLRPPVPRPDGQARRRLHRGPLARRLDRPEVDAAATRARPSARSPRSTTTSACCSRGSGARTARSAARRSRGRRRSRSSTASWSSTEGTRFQVLAPVDPRAARASTSTCSASCRPRASPGPGSTATCHSLTEPPTLKKQEKHTIEVVVDRLAVKADAKRRLTDSVETALRPRRRAGHARLRRPAEDDPHRERIFSEQLACPYDDLSFEELEPRSFSFNSPFGACPSAPASAPGWRSTPS